jgi:hypothetical protein
MSEERPCVVKVFDDGIEHAIEVTAASVYEAAVLALRHFRRRPWSGNAAYEGFLRIEVWEPPTTRGKGWRGGEMPRPVRPDTP